MALPDAETGPRSGGPRFAVLGPVQLIADGELRAALVIAERVDAPRVGGLRELLDALDHRRNGAQTLAPPTAGGGV